VGELAMKISKERYSEKKDADVLIFGLHGDMLIRDNLMGSA
jgi:hypothetical protein